MNNIVDVTYAQSGRSTTADAMGMRPMQARVYRERGAQHILLKAPPASGKSRALMFVGLDKLANQGIRKVVVAVPERSIGGSFASTDLSRHGFFRDWVVDPRYDLCSGVGETSSGTIDRFIEFMQGDGEILVCTHATLRFAFDRLDVSAFDDCLVAVDEYHHTSISEDNRLGELVRRLMERDKAHILAMTGSYFRGDNFAVMRPEDEARFTKVVYSYYEQLNGYEHLAELGIGYHFYRGVYLEAIDEVLDTDKATILHIPNVNAAESTKDKLDEVERILSTIGTYQHTDPDTGFLVIARHGDGKILRVANLVDDDPVKRPRVVAALRGIETRDELDLIVALGMAKEGFDWVWCEVALTVGYRNSLTEIIQIIGRATRDAPGKRRAQFINLIAEPDSSEDTVARAVNDMLKAISASLLMEQVMAPKFEILSQARRDEERGTAPRTGQDDDGQVSLAFDVDEETGTISVGIKGLREPSSDRVREIVDKDMTDLIANVAQDPGIQASGVDRSIPPEVVNQVHIPRIIESRYTDLDPDQVEEVRQQLVARMALLDAVQETGLSGKSANDGEGRGDSSFVDLTRRFVSISDLDIDLIDSINPFQRAYEVVSKSLDAPLLGRIQNVIAGRRAPMTEEEARALWPRIDRFIKEKGREPVAGQVADELEVRMALALDWLRREHARRQASQ